MRKELLDRLIFIRQFVRAPRQTGSVAPSSIFLAKTMLNAISWERTESLVELGAGTGAITRHIKEAQKDNVHVMLFEKDEKLRSRLADGYPEYSCHADATNLQLALLEKGIEQVDCILSGLPFFNFPQSVRDRLMDEIISSLRPGGSFIAFQYSQQMRRQLERLFVIEHIYFVPLNIPPAFVYICRKRGD